MPLEILILIALCAAPAAAEIYRWRDRDGTVHFTDNLQSVPPDQRPRADAIDDRLPPAPQPHFIPLEHAGQGYIVEAQINRRRSVRLVVDTGATSTVLAPRVLRDLGVAVQRNPPVTIHTANGSTQAGWAQLDDLRVGGRSSGPLQVVVHDAVPGADGLLGMNYLGAYRVEIRAKGPYLLLSPP